MRRAIGTRDGGSGSWESQDPEASASRRSPLAGADEISAGVHEVQNALTSALFSVDVARRSADPAERARALTTIERTIDRARAMLSVLADPAERFHVQCAPFRMAAVVEEIAALLRPRCESAGVRLLAQVDGDPKAFGDSDRVVQVLTNLVLNALDAVQALARRPAQRGVISLVARERPDGACEFVVSDDGSGMSAETLARVFEPGFTTHPRAEGARRAGSGLGMSVSRMLSQAMGGDLILRSTEGRGTEVFVVLPRGEVTSAPAPMGVKRDEDLPPGLRVLVVDDEPSIRELLVTALSLRGATVRAVASLHDARAALVMDSFDVALVDETLGVTDRGAVLVEEMLDHHPSATVLLMTGAPTVDHLPARVARCLLRKPFSLDDAVRTILRARGGESTG
jgi:CheY-like chemotaxis protein